MAGYPSCALLERWNKVIQMELHLYNGRKATGLCSRFPVVPAIDWPRCP